MIALFIGGVPVKQLCIQFDVRESTVRYHINPRTRKKTIERAKRRYFRTGGTPYSPEKRREYNRKYMKERYNNDPEFRERMLKHMSRYQRKEFINKKRL